MAELSSSALPFLQLLSRKTPFVIGELVPLATASASRIDTPCHRWLPLTRCTASARGMAVCPDSASGRHIHHHGLVVMSCRVGLLAEARRREEVGRLLVIPCVLHLRLCEITPVVIGAPTPVSSTVAI